LFIILIRAAQIKCGFISFSSDRFFICILFYYNFLLLISLWQFLKIIAFISIAKDIALIYWCIKSCRDDRLFRLKIYLLSVKFYISMIYFFLNFLTDHILYYLFCKILLDLINFFKKLIIIWRFLYWPFKHFFHGICLMVTKVLKHNKNLIKFHSLNLFSIDFL
jgi:hypothetical protein